MSVFELKHLMLHKPFVYAGASPSTARAAADAASAGTVTPVPDLETDLSTGSPALAAEGGEELFVFEADQFIVFDKDDGPRLAARLPAPVFYGRLGGGQNTGAAHAGQNGAAPSSGAADTAAALYTLEPGAYLLLQWRPADSASLREGIEYFARQAWWEDEKTEGPYCLRRLREDSRIATQLWRRRKL